MVYRALLNIKLMWNLMLVFVQLIEEICWIHRVILLYSLILTKNSNFFYSFFFPSDRFRWDGCTGHVLVLIWLRVKMRQKIVVGFTFFLIKLSILLIFIVCLRLFWLCFYYLLLFLYIFSVSKMLSIIKFFFLLVMLLFRNNLNLLLIFYFLVMCF